MTARAGGARDRPRRRPAQPAVADRGRARAFAGLDRASSAQVAAMLAALVGGRSARTVVGAMAGDPGGCSVGGRSAPDWALRPPARRSRLDRASARRALRRGIRTRRALRGAGRRGRRRPSSAEQDPARERAWVAARGGEILGASSWWRSPLRWRSCGCSMSSQRCGASGSADGGRAAIGFAGAAGYREITLWTNDILHAARRLYQRRGLPAGRLGAAPVVRSGSGRRDLDAGPGARPRSGRGVGGEEGRDGGLRRRRGCARPGGGAGRPGRRGR